jgi:hypothetical protein
LKRTQYHETLLFPQHNLLRRRHAGKDEQQVDVFSYISRDRQVEAVV